MAKGKAVVPAKKGNKGGGITRNDSWHESADSRLQEIRRLKSQISTNALQLAFVVHHFVTEDQYEKYGFSCAKDWAISEGLDPSKAARWVAVCDRLVEAGVTSADRVKLSVDPDVLWIAKDRIKAGTLTKILNDVNTLPTRQFAETYGPQRPEAPNERDPHKPPSNRGRVQQLVEAACAGTAEQVTEFAERFAAEAGAGIHNISMMVKMSGKMNGSEVGKALATIFDGAKSKVLSAFAESFVASMSKSAVRNFCAAVVSAVPDAEERCNVLTAVITSTSISDVHAVRLNEELDGAVNRFTPERERKAG